MKLVGLCSFYDESPTWLAACATSAARLVDHLVFVDGAYVLYDKDGYSSGVEAHDAIARACHAANVGYTLHVPETAWLGNEVEKRGAMFRLAESLTTSDDWYVVIDADTILRDVDPSLVRRQLETDEFDAYDVHLAERTDWCADGKLTRQPSETSCPLTCFFRAIRGLTTVGAHYVFAYPDETAQSGWTALWGAPTEFDVAPHGQLEVTFEHWSKFRPADRRAAAWDYYNLRDKLRIEKTARSYIETVGGDAAEIN